jgi:hypothetical protein
MEKKRDSIAESRTVKTFEDGKLYISRIEDIEPVLQENEYARNHQGNNGYGKSRVWRKIGSIPCVIAEQILREHGVNILDGSPEADAFVRKYLQENRAFRTVDKL